MSPALLPAPFFCEADGPAPVPVPVPEPEPELDEGVPTALLVPAVLAALLARVLTARPATALP